MIVNRRRQAAELPVLPSLTVDIVRGNDPVRPIKAKVGRLTAETVVIECASGVDALAVAMSPQLTLHFQGPGLQVIVGGTPGRRVDDVHGSRSVELVLDRSAQEVRLTG